MVRVGLVGCGTIGTRLALALDRDYRRVARLVALHDTDPQQAATLKRRLTGHPPIVPLGRLIRRSQLVIEAASPEAARAVARLALREGRSVFIMSPGGLLGDRSWERLARRSGGRVHIPSGALAALDGINAMALGRIRRMSLITRKPPGAFASSPYVRRRRLTLSRLPRARLLFEGSPRQVVRAFPQNTNVAAALSLAARRSRATVRVRVIADPSLRRNVHELDVEGDCGRIRCRVESRPSANPKTSELAARSAVATLRRLFDPVRLGT